MRFYLLSNWGAREAMMSSSLARTAKTPAGAMKRARSEEDVPRLNLGDKLA
jgi:hypothetical protein